MFEVNFAARGSVVSVLSSLPLLSILYFNFFSSGDKPKTNKINDVVIVIITNGKNTINHDNIVKPFSHKIFKMIKNIIMTINFIRAVLYKFLNMSIII